MQDEGYVPDAVDTAYIESLGRPVHRVLAAIEAAAMQPTPPVPILDRASGRVLAVLAAGRRRILEVGTAFGYSTLWMALAQPPDGTIVTIDPDRSRTDRARAWWREAGLPDGRITVVSRPALEAFEAHDGALQGPFDLAFIDALKEEYVGYLAAIRPRLAPGALVIADNVLWSGRVARLETSDGAATAALRAFNADVLRAGRWQASILPLGDGLLIATAV